MYATYPRMYPEEVVQQCPDANRGVSVGVWFRLESTFRADRAELAEPILSPLRMPVLAGHRSGGPETEHDFSGWLREA